MLSNVADILYSGLHSQLSLFTLIFPSDTVPEKALLTPTDLETKLNRFDLDAVNPACGPNKERDVLIDVSGFRLATEPIPKSRSPDGTPNVPLDAPGVYLSAYIASDQV
jgi:hypothetical protein